MKITKTFFFIIILVLVFSQGVFALTANSSNYSVSRFSAGLSTSNASSTSYTALSLSESSKGTTRNAEGDIHTSNIGFFDNTPYYRTVSITSYSVYPSSSEIISTIRLYISALNSESVWINITRPDGVVDRVALSNNDYKYYTAGIIGRYNITFYANSSIGAISSIVDSFDVTEKTVTPPSTGGGGGIRIVMENCSYIWDCTPWGICAEGKQKRECKNIENCNGTENKPIEEMNCSEALFDIDIQFNKVELTENKTLRFSVDLIEKKGVEKIDVLIKYSIINSKNIELFSQMETKAIQQNLTYNKEVTYITLEDGKYILRVDVLYGNLQRASSELSFNIINGKIEIEEPKRDNIISFFEKGNYKILLIIISIIILISIGLCLFFIFRKMNHKKRFKERTKGLVEYKTKIKNNLKRIKFRALSMILMGFIFIGVLFILRSKITGFATNNLFIERNNWNLFWFILIIGILGFLTFIYKNKIKAFVDKIKEIFKFRYPKNSIKGLIKKKVYTEEGYYMGEVEEVFLKDNKIDSLKIKLDKKYEFRFKGLIVKYKEVKSVGGVVIVSNLVFEHLGKT